MYDYMCKLKQYLQLKIPKSMGITFSFENILLQSEDCMYSFIELNLIENTDDVLNNFTFTTLPIQAIFINWKLCLFISIYCQFLIERVKILMLMLILSFLLISLLATRIIRLCVPIPSISYLLNSIKTYPTIHSIG